MQQKHIWREDMRLQHAKPEMPMDYLSSDVQKRDILDFEVLKRSLGCKPILEGHYW